MEESGSSGSGCDRVARTSEEREAASPSNGDGMKRSMYISHQSTDGDGAVEVGSYRFLPLIDPADPAIKEDIVRIIVQYLDSEGLHASARTIEDEARVKLSQQEVASLSNKPVFRGKKSFLYAVYKQQYLELLEAKEYQQAYSHLIKKLKPLESMEGHPGEFRDLCYLLTCSSIHFSAMLHLDANVGGHGPKEVPQGRLMQLLRQAAAYQIEFSQYHPKVIPRLTTLLSDYSYTVLPNQCLRSLDGHDGSIKCVSFVGEEGLHVVSGGSDNTVKMWDSDSGECVHTLEGHAARIWSVCSNKAGVMVGSGSGDATIRTWDVTKGVCASVLRGHDGDVYSVEFHPGMVTRAQHHLGSGGYDKTARLFDVTTGQLLKTFSGHDSAVARIAFNPHGNILISGSKDCTVKFWDLTSGVCLMTLPRHLGEVTSVQCNRSGNLLLSSSKDNSNRLWDLRMTKAVVRYKGHQNTSKNFVRANFGPNEEYVIGGSEDGGVYIWDTNTGALLNTLRGHSDIVYSGEWSEKKSMLASCSDDATLRLWAHVSVKDSNE